MGFSRRTVPLVLLTCVAGPLATLAAGAGEAGAANVTATSVLAAAKAAMGKERSLHLAVTSKFASTKTSVTADFGASSGMETIESGGADVTIKVTPSYGYMSGNSSGLTTIVGLTAAQLKKVGKDWISMKAGTAQYSDLKDSTTYAAIKSALPAAKGTTLSSQVKNGVKLYVLKWTTAATSSVPKTANVLTISATGKPLPIEEVTTASNGSGTTTFSRWDETVRVAAPASGSTVTYATVTG
jgi:hypothetical protein